MGNVIWKGNAPYTAQVDTLTPGTVETGDIFTATINGKSVSYTAAAATVADVTAGFTAAWNALTAAGGYAEFAEITATDSTTHITLTHDTAGVPFTVTTSTTNGGAADTQTFVQATTTAASSPNHWSIAANWDTGAVPVNSDDVYIDQSSVSILYGLDQNAVTLTSLTITSRFTGYIGLPLRNSGGYEEYREDYLKISYSTLTVGQQAGGPGSGRIKLNGGSVQMAATVEGSATRVEAAIPSVLLVGTHASNTLDVTGGDVGVAVLPTETATFATVRQTAGTLVFGSGCTLTTVNKADGTLTVDSNVTTLVSEAGTTTKRSGTTTTLTVSGGTCYYDGRGTITTLNVNNSGVVSFDRSNKTGTVTNTNLNDSGTIRDKFDVITFTNAIAWKGVIKASPA